jgi:hypothetical protein
MTTKEIKQVLEFIQNRCKETKQAGIDRKELEQFKELGHFKDIATTLTNLSYCKYPTEPNYHRIGLTEKGINFLKPCYKKIDWKYTITTIISISALILSLIAIYK